MKFIAFLIAGLAMGPACLAIDRPSWIGTASQLAVGLFLFFAGFELQFLGFLKARRFFAILFSGSFILPASICYFLFDRNLFLAVALSISALPIAIQILKEKNLFDSQLAREAITTSSLCDVAAWGLLAFLLPRESVGEWLMGHWVFFMFFAGILASAFFGKLHRFDSVFSKAQSYLLAPVFFVTLGWQLNLLGFFDLKVFSGLFVVAVLTKGLGTFAAARIAGRSSSEALQLSAILNARGAMEIMAAQFAFHAKIIDGPVFAALVCIGILTSMMALPLVPRKISVA